MRYAILIMNTEASRQLQPDQWKAWSEDIGAWYEAGHASGKIFSTGEHLQEPDTAKTIRASGVTDGPFIETKEVVGGFSVINADSVDEAVEYARTWPGVDKGWITIEVRPVNEL